MHSHYLDRPLLPLDVVLPRLLEEIEADLANVRIGAAEKERLRRRANVIKGLLSRQTEPP